MTDSTTHTTCPLLGLAVDRTVMLGEPTPDHRCYGQHPLAAPTTACQKTFCLGADYIKCATYQVAQAIPAHYQITQPPRARGRLKRWPVLLTLGSVSLLGCLLLVASFFSPLRLRLFALLPLPLERLVAASPFGAPATNQEALPAPLAVTLLLTPTLTSPSLASPSLTSASLTSNITPTPLPIVTPISTTAPGTPSVPTARAGNKRFATPTAEPGGQVIQLGPSAGNAGWWKDPDSQRNHLGDSYLYAGAYGGETFIATVRFDLTRVARGAPIRQAQLRLTGLRQAQFQAEAEGIWLVQLLPQSSIEFLESADYLTMLSAPAAMPLFPPLSASDLAPNRVNEWDFDEATRLWLEKQLLDGATTLTIRIQASIQQGEALFAWDSGLGAETQGDAPTLLLSLGLPPPTPPILPTRPLIVATLTPIPQDVLTVVAFANTATAVAVTTGTYTPVPYAVVTPTPYPGNLATVQAVALAFRLPPVILHTPTPFSPLIEARNAEYATAVALTTGTFTPIPTEYVTPMLIAPSPPAENVATAAARVVAATAVAASGAPTPTPLPYNAVIAVYVYATPVPENAATAIAVAMLATDSAKVDGTPTPLPWHGIIITAVPTPTEIPPPTATPLPLLQSVTEFTPTPTPPAQLITPDTLPEYLRNKIIFKTNRNGAEEVYALDPATSELYRINERWVFPLAQQRMGIAPDGQQQAIVHDASDRTKQIHLRSLAHNTVRQITALTGAGTGRVAINYDPDWSPKGDLIVFVSTNSGNDEIYTVTVDGAILTQLTMNSYEWDKHPSWSPDGNQIVFFSNRESGRRQLWLMNADGSGQRNLSNNEYEDWDPIWIR